MLHMIEVLHREKERALTIGFSGAGGKTTSLYMVASELIKMHEKVLITTTTKMYLEQKYLNIPIVLRETFLEDDLNLTGACQWFGSSTAEDKGIAPEVSNIEEMHKYTNLWKLIEIDGSKHHPIKAPESNEPIYVNGMDLVFGVIGASVVGKPATAAWVHRLERFLEVTGAKQGDLITPELLRRLIVSPAGLFKGLPASASACVLLTQVKAEDLPWIDVLKTQIDIPIEVIPWDDNLHPRA